MTIFAVGVLVTATAPAANGQQVLGVLIALTGLAVFLAQPGAISRPERQIHEATED
ncbi:hypothetical protein [Brachybacterium nesterenkovii]|uniref:hypothetical protein n=1 Tax=Brachybacterium nesterenkovii TaxID=47847 RepID=UPI00321957A2